MAHKANGNGKAHTPRKKRGRPPKIAMTPNGDIVGLERQLRILAGELKQLESLAKLSPKMRKAVRSIPLLPPESQETVYQVVRNVRRKPGRPWME